MVPTLLFIDLHDSQSSPLRSLNKIRGEIQNFCWPVVLQELSYISAGSLVLRGSLN